MRKQLVILLNCICFQPSTYEWSLLTASTTSVLSEFQARFHTKYVQLVSPLCSGCVQNCRNCTRRLNNLEGANITGTCCCRYYFLICIQAMLNFKTRIQLFCTEYCDTETKYSSLSPEKNKLWAIFKPACAHFLPACISSRGLADGSSTHWDHSTVGQLLGHADTDSMSYE